MALQTASEGAQDKHLLPRTGRPTRNLQSLWQEIRTIQLNFHLSVAKSMREA